jgi:hypothetical protein
LLEKGNFSKAIRYNIWEDADIGIEEVDDKRIMWSNDANE